MKALSIQQPWASLIASSAKTLEVRSWTTRYRGPLLVCASSKASTHFAALGHERGPMGVAICVVDLVDIREGHAGDVARTGGVDPTGYYVWVLRDPRHVEHVPVKGKLGLFHPTTHVGSFSSLRTPSAASS